MTASGFIGEKSPSERQHSRKPKVFGKARVGAEIGAAKSAMNGRVALRRSSMIDESAPAMGVEVVGADVAPFKRRVAALQLDERERIANAFDDEPLFVEQRERQLQSRKSERFNAAFESSHDGTRSPETIERSSVSSLGSSLSTLTAASGAGCRKNG